MTMLGNTENAARDAKAALAATERFITSVGGRLTAFEGRFGGLETRMTALEDRMTGLEHAIDDIARSQHRMETMLTTLLGDRS